MLVRSGEGQLFLFHCVSEREPSSALAESDTARRKIMDILLSQLPEGQRR